MDNNYLFEERLVRWILKYYELDHCRAKWMVLDQEQELLREDESIRDLQLEGPIHDADTRLLTLRAFHAFFPGFPITLNCHHLNAANAPTAEKLLATLDRHSMIRTFRQAWNDEKHHRRAGIYNKSNDGRPFGVVFRWKPIDFKHAVVIHTAIPVEIDVPGGHLLWTCSDGLKVMVESLSVFLQSIDLQCPPENWKETAIRESWDELVVNRGTT